MSFHPPRQLMAIFQPWRLSHCTRSTVFFLTEFCRLVVTRPLTWSTVGVKSETGKREPDTNRILILCGYSERRVSHFYHVLPTPSPRNSLLQLNCETMAHPPMLISIKSLHNCTALCHVAFFDLFTVYEYWVSRYSPVLVTCQYCEGSLLTRTLYAYDSGARDFNTE